jgi:hypothetical protein
VEEGYASTHSGEPTPTLSSATPTPARRARAGGALALILAATALAGCGGSNVLQSSASTEASSTTATHASSKPVVCAPAARAALAHALSMTSAGVTERAGTSNEATPQCTFRAGKVEVVAIVDSAPQPYFRLERTVVEATQQFSSAPLPMPVHIGGLGLDADWFPQPKQLETTDGRRLITVGVVWHGVPTKLRVALAKVIARTYLGPLDRKAADPNGS